MGTIEAAKTKYRKVCTYLGIDTGYCDKAFDVLIANMKAGMQAFK